MKTTILFFLLLLATSFGADEGELSRMPVRGGVLVLSMTGKGAKEARELWFNTGNRPPIRLFSQIEHPELVLDLKLPPGVGMSQISKDRVDKIVSAFSDGRILAAILSSNGSRWMEFIRTDLGDRENSVQDALVNMMVPVIQETLSQIKLIDDENIESKTSAGIKKMLRWNRNGDVFLEGELLAHSVNLTDAGAVTPISPKPPEPRRSPEDKPPTPREVESPSDRAKLNGYFWGAGIFIMLAGIGGWYFFRFRRGKSIRP